MSKVCNNEQLQVIKLRLSTPDTGQNTSGTGQNTSGTAQARESSNTASCSRDVSDMHENAQAPSSSKSAFQQNTSNALSSPSTSGPSAHKRRLSAPAEIFTPAQLQKRSRRLSTDVTDLLDSDDSGSFESDQVPNRTKVTALEAELMKVR